jgi:hypothetical protein
VYKNESGATITVNISSEDVGLCFIECVSEVISDDCGFLAQGIGCLDPQCDCSPPPPTTSTTTTTTTTLTPTTTTTTTESPTTTTTTTASPTTTTTTTVSPYCYVIESVQSTPGECFDCPGFFASTTDTFIKFYDGCGGTQIPAPFDINVTAHYSDASTQTTFIPSGTTGNVLIATSDIQCAPLPSCGEVASPTFDYAVVTPVSGSISECCIGPTTTTTTTAVINCGNSSSYSGGSNYPTEQSAILGTDTGNVVLNYGALDAPERFIVEWNSNVVIDTGYRGAPDFDFGGLSRIYFNNALNGKIDPITLNQYPDLTTYPDDGYPRILGNGQGTASFNKNLTTPTSATVKVYSAFEITAWSYRLDCPV